MPPTVRENDYIAGTPSQEVPTLRVLNSTVQNKETWTEVYVPGIHNFHDGCVRKGWVPSLI